MTAYMLLAAIAWAVATRGGTSPRDLLVVLLLLGTATVLTRAWPERNLIRTAAIIALLGWLLVAGPLRVGPTIESIRVPLLVVVATLTVAVVRRLDRENRETFLAGLVVLGCLHAVVALAEMAVTISRGLEAPARASSLLGSPNGLGMLLVATSVLTAREVTRRPGVLPTAALALQGCALLATGSRTALVVAAALLVGYAVARPGWRIGSLAAAGVIAGTVVVVWRFATEPPEQRPHLWLQALSRISDRPLMGEGPMSAPFSTSSAGARVTTHAHNEILQWGVEYGLVGVGLGLLVVLLSLRSMPALGNWDRWILVAGAALIAGAMTDFTLRITALTVAAAALAALTAANDPLGSAPEYGRRTPTRRTGGCAHPRTRSPSSPPVPHLWANQRVNRPRPAALSSRHRGG